MIISIINQKGGVGKTTSTHNLSYAIGNLNKKVLMIDFDPQGSLTKSVGISSQMLEERLTTYDVMTNPDLDINNAIIKMDKYDFIPSTIDLATAEIEIIQSGQYNNVLKQTLDKIKDQYDFILIDGPPSLGVLSVNTLVASDSVIVPVETSYLALEGMILVFKTISEVKKNLNQNLFVHTILPTKYDSRTLHHNEVLNSLKDDYGDYVFDPIKSSVQVSDSNLGAMCMVEFNPIHVISQTYNKLAEVIVNG